MMIYELLSVISITLLALFLFFPYNAYRVDWLRQNTFALRDQLFDEARKGTIRFDSEAYKATRSLLNGVIRFSHRISFSRVIAARFIIKTNLRADDLTFAMNASSVADRELCARYITRADEIVLMHIFSSPLVWMFIVPQVFALVLSQIGIDVAGNIVRLCKRQFADFNRIAFFEGQT